jgi:hypothetical protein
MTRIFPVVLALLSSLPAFAQSGVSDAKPVFLVTDVVVADDVGIDREVARDVLATRFGRIKDKIEVRSMAEAKAGMDAAALAQLLGEGDDDALAKVEQYVQVDRIVFGRIAKVAGVIDLQVKVFNVKESVTEVGFARRLAAGAPPSMVLTLLDTLADSLLAWTLNTYTDGSRSASAEKLAGKKLTPKKDGAEVPAPAPSGSRFSWLGTVGGLGLGLGAGAAAAAGYSALENDGVVGETETALLITGGVVGALGAGVLVVDLLTE